MEENIYKALVFLYDKRNERKYENSDNLYIYNINGNDVITSQLNNGDLCLYFLVNTQIASWFLLKNKQYRENPENPEEKWKGFFEQTGNVKAIKLRGVISNGFIFKLDDKYKNILVPNSSIDELDGKQLCWKYISKKEREYIKTLQEAIKPKRIKRKYNKNKFINYFIQKYYNLVDYLSPSIVDMPLIKEHIKTSHLALGINALKKDDELTITVKMHGTSGRTGALLQTKKVWVWDKKSLKDSIESYPINYGLQNIIKLLTYQTGTRRTMVVNDINHKLMNNGFYGSNEFRKEIHNKLVPFLEDGMTIYYEIVGYANNKPIQKPHGKYNYSYGCSQNECEFYIYRITALDENNRIVEYTYDQIYEFCIKNKLKPVYKLISFIYSGDSELLLNYITELGKKLQFSDPTNPNGLLEGFVITNNKTSPEEKVTLKYKTPEFILMENQERLKNVDEMDIETIN